MPCLYLYTNLPGRLINPKFQDEAAEFLAQLFERPVKTMVVHLVASQSINFDGTRAPCAIGEVQGLERMGFVEKSIYQTVLRGNLTESLRIPADRIYVTFTHFEPEDDPSDNE